MTAHQKICGLALMLDAVADFGRQPNDPGTQAEDELLLKLAMCAAVMGTLLRAHAGTMAPAKDEGQTTVTE